MNAPHSTCANPGGIQRVLLHDGPPPPGVQSICRPGVPAPLARLLAAGNYDAQQRAVDEMLAAVGCDWLAFGALMPSREGGRPVSVCIAHADHEWIRHYCAEAYFDVDPRLSDAMRSSLPVTWTVAGLEARTASASARAPARRFVEDLSATGMRGGAFLALPGEANGLRHFVSLLARKPAPRLLAGDMVGEILTLGLCLHEYYTRNSSWAEPVDCMSSLTSVQREILGHVARGESDKFIARHLGISSYAVDYHMRQLRKRFSVRNRVQLARSSRAIFGF